MNNNRMYIAIDLKSFYASVECAERNLDPMKTNLVVADESRTTKTICLAVSPSLKSFGISGRARLFEVVKRVEEINAERKRKNNGQNFKDISYDIDELNCDSSLELGYIIALPRMSYYIQYSTRIYQIYLKYVSEEDIHVYSIDEVFIDVTEYLKIYKMTASELAKTIIKDILYSTGITATAGVGTNMYLCKVAMDIVAKHVEADQDGVRIAELTERSYREQLWNHRPLTDFWRIGRGIAKKLEQHNIMTMGDVARCSIGKENEYYNEELLYKLFGINAELLIDHAWGWEPCTIKDVKDYKPENNSISSGQVLHVPYTAEKAKLITREMVDLLVLDLVDKNVVCDQIVITIGYDRENLSNKEIRNNYEGTIKKDYYGRMVPTHAHGSKNLEKHTSSTRLIMDAAMELFDEIIDWNLLIRRINVTANHVIEEKDIQEQEKFVQMDLFTDYEALQEKKKAEMEAEKKEKNIQKAMLEIKNKYGKNAILKGMNLQEGATTIERNRQIGGHKA